ncbi:ribosome biogenesis factor YjgA [Glaciecola petra]|uniref:Dual-action ribosomal maturation protein DarP n=1 Tax=Glaciecola petra TaxID=3075602 RepID=A0ABU2ZTW1_9ALTE|nr:ribosome biogenesis factor YjgA [Aestuariibacter sp. P117]MDT0596083.1 ribosome biogenesis factor YjgA [Aestuariibacter sp. P117]
MRNQSTENKVASNIANEQEFESKTQQKQAAERLKKLGLALVDLTKGEREKMPLDDELLGIIELATKINRKKDGFRRQLQLIGKKLRARDVAPIEDSLQRLRTSHSDANRHFHNLERLRDDIVAKGNDGINDAVAEYPQLERQKLRQLLRLVQKQEKENKPPAAAREIFQYLKQEIPER